MIFINIVQESALRELEEPAAHLLVSAAIIPQTTKIFFWMISAVYSQQSSSCLQKVQSTDWSAELSIGQFGHFIPKRIEDGKRREVEWNREATGLRQVGGGFLVLSLSVAAEHVVMRRLMARSQCHRGTDADAECDTRRTDVR
jgi:hypothetical protein